MKTRWPGLLLLALAITASPLAAQNTTPTPTDRPSHKPIRTGLEEDLSPEQRLARRLQNPRDRKGNLDKLDKMQLDDSMKELAKRLLEDKDLIESLRKNLKPEDIDRLKNTIEANRGLADDPALRKLFEQSMAGKTLTDQDKALIQRWKDNVGQQGNPPVTPPVTPPNQQPPTPPNQQPPTPPNAGKASPLPKPQTPPSNWDRPQQTPEWLKKNLDKSSRDLTKWLDSPSGKSFSKNLTDIGKRATQTRSNLPPVSKRVSGASKYLPKPGEWMLDRVRPRNAPRIGSLPRVGSLPRMPSGSSVPRVSASGLGRVVVIAAVVALLIFLVWHTRGWWQAAIAARFASSWRLGPWPVRPDQVTTRGDLVRAFEYLALLCLGPSARTHHHLALGRLIGEQPSLDPDRRRDAASTLARLYEQARYTPDDEPLSPQAAAEARRELGHLAGEMAA